jgi:hypothetical protein
MKFSNPADIQFNSPMILRKLKATESQIEFFVQSKIFPVNELLRQTKSEILLVDRNPDLSSEGKARRKQAVYQETWAALEKIGKESAQTYGKYIVEMSGKIKTPEYKSEDKTLDYLRAQEVRQILYKMSGEERLAGYQAALEQDDLFLASCFESNPVQSLKPLLPQEELTRGREFRTKKNNPELMREISITDEMRHLVLDAIDSAKQIIVNDGYAEGRKGLPIDSGIVAAAGV